MINLLRTQHRRCSSVVEQRIRNAWVVSSNLTSGSPSTGNGGGAGAAGLHASVAQLVEQLTLNQFVRGSSPRGGTKTAGSFIAGLPAVFFACQGRRRGV